MRVLKAFLVLGIGLFCVITLFSLLIPSRVRVSRAVLINNTSVAEVNRQIANFENWKNWHPIFTVDFAKIIANPSASNGKKAGSIIRHRGKDVKLTLLENSTANTRFLLQSSGENDIDNDVVLTDYPGQHAVQVEWRSITRLHWYPWEKFYGIFLDKLTGPGYEAALNGLKSFMETGRQPAAIIDSSKQL